MTKKEFKEKVDAANKEVGRTLNPGLTHLCATCVSNFGYSDKECEHCGKESTAAELFERDVEEGEVFDEGGFSNDDCEVCGNSDGGNRYSAHGWVEAPSKDVLVHYDICEDCMIYLANGDLPSHLED